MNKIYDWNYQQTPPHNTQKCHFCQMTMSEPSVDHQEDSNVLLVKLFFRLISEVTEKRASPEILDRVIRLRESWQQDLDNLRTSLHQQNKPREKPKKPQAKKKVRAPRFTPNLGNAFRMLGLGPKANLTQVQQAFRRLAIQYHPDKNPCNPNAEEFFKNLNQAYLTACSHFSHQVS